MLWLSGRAHHQRPAEVDRRQRREAIPEDGLGAERREVGDVGVARLVQREELAARNIRLRVLGRVDEMDKSVRRELDLALEATADCTGMTLNVALNYSGRCEIVDACRRIVTDWAQGEHVEIDESTLGEYLYTSGQPDPDLVIRTSGELRLSNFLLWQIAYAEIWVTDTLWPDFRCRDFFEGILAYQQRSRRYGSIESTLKEHGAA